MCLTMTFLCRWLDLSTKCRRFAAFSATSLGHLFLLPNKHEAAQSLAHSLKMSWHAREYALFRGWPSCWWWAIMHLSFFFFFFKFLVIFFIRLQIIWCHFTFAGRSKLLYCIDQLHPTIIFLLVYIIYIYIYIYMYICSAVLQLTISSTCEKENYIQSWFLWRTFSQYLILNDADKNLHLLAPQRKRFLFCIITSERGFLFLIKNLSRL